MSALLAPALYYKDFTNGGAPLAFGLVYSYAAGTSTPQATYVDSTQTTQNTNPVALNARGEASIWLNPALAYKFVVTDSNGNIIRTVDNVLGFNAAVAQALTASIIGSAFYPRTAAEIAANITPSSYAYPELYPQRYGFLGGSVNSVVDTAAVLAAISVAQWGTTSATAFASYPAGYYTTAKITFPQNSSFYCNSQLTWDSNRIGFDGAGTAITFPSTLGSAALAPWQSNTDVNVRAAQNTAHPFENFYLNGPGVTVTSVTALLLNDATVGDSLACLTFRNVAFVDFSTDVTFSNGSFCTTFDSCTFNTTFGGGSNYSIVQQAGTNSGERQNFLNCGWFNKYYLLSNASSSGDMFCMCCSFDYFITAFYLTGGSIWVTDSHIEASSDTANWGYVTGGNTVLSIAQSTISLAANKEAYDMFYSDGVTSPVTNGGVSLRDILIGMGGLTVFSTNLIGGTGNAFTSNIMQENASYHPPISAATNALAYADLTSSAWANDWTLGGTTHPSRVTSPAPPSGTYCMEFQGASENAPTATITRACKPGQYMQGLIYYQAPAISGTNFEFAITVSYLDVSGAQIVGYVPLAANSTNVAAWEAIQFYGATPAPAGTVNARLSLSGSSIGTTSGTPLAYIAGNPQMIVSIV
jgi:hypothetical protein